MGLISTSLEFQRPPQKQVSLPNVTEFVGEVIDIVLNDTHPDFEALGGWSIIGIIKYRPLEDNSPKNILTYSYALPIDGNIKTYPIKGEFVRIVSGLPSSFTQGKESFTINYYKNIVNINNNSQYNPYQKSDSFTENSDHKSVLPKNGDVILEGRFQNSLKFTSDNEGNPLTIIRNGRPVDTNNKKFVSEDINNDDSVIIFSSKGTIPLTKRLNTKSHFVKAQNKNISTPNISNNIENKSLENITLTQESIIDDSSTREDELVDFPVEGYDNMNDDSFQLDKVEVENPSIYTFDEYQTSDISPNQKVNRINFLDYSKFCNFTEKDLPIPIRALLDTIAWTEGTIGQGENGYNIGSNYIKIPNWSVNFQLGCPQLKITFINKVTKQKSFTLSKGYWGRYQYGIDTWKTINGKNIAFNKRNQDLSASSSIKKALGQVVYDNLHSYMTNISGVYKICEKLSRIWASIPNGALNISYYTLTKDGITTAQKSRTCQSIQDFYLKAYKLNDGK
jgi:hypothetical protein